MKMRKRVALGAIWLLTILLTAAPAWAEDSLPFHVVKVSPQDRKAVVKMHDGALKVVGVGDVLGQAGKVVEVSPQRLVLETATSEGMVTTIVRLDGEHQRVDTVHQQGGPPPQVVAPLLRQN